MIYYYLPFGQNTVKHTFSETMVHSGSVCMIVDSSFILSFAIALFAGLYNLLQGSEIAEGKLSWTTNPSLLIKQTIQILHMTCNNEFQY